jgi:hypothetical protein
VKNHRQDKEINKLLTSLQERAKELNCLYAVEELLNQPDITPLEACEGIIKAIPPGWQYPDICQAKIQLNGDTLKSPHFKESLWQQSAEVKALDRPVGTIWVYYNREMPQEDDGPFLKEETRLVRTIADRLGHFIHHYEMKLLYQEWESARNDLSRKNRQDWRIILDLLSHTDKNLFMQISHKMLNHLCWSGIKKAEALLAKSELFRQTDYEVLLTESNAPYQGRAYSFPENLTNETFQIASENLSDEEILSRIQKWMQEDKLGFLVRAVERQLSLTEIADAIRRYHHIASKEEDLSQPARAGVRVSLIRRFLSDQLPYIRVAKEHIGINDFYELLQYMIFSGESQGRLGGKSAGLYLAAQILKHTSTSDNHLGKVKIPKTWHLTSDLQLHFMHYNNLDEIVEQKYKPISQIRFEYPYIVHTCKSSRFPPEVIKGLSLALDDFGETPLIVRSSSVLEDRIGAAFSGKYKSLFLANQGSKKERLDALLDAIAEVYASMFGPDPMEYRAERGLLDFAEEMGVMIQEVVGTRIGPYFMPTFAGVAFSRNEFRWSPRIKREDGLMRLVPGLGTRAVDRVSDDYPVLFAPGQPGLRVNRTADEILRYSPKWMDVINLEKNCFETIDVHQFLREYREVIPGANLMISVHEDGHIRRPSVLDTDVDSRNIVVTFDGLFERSEFLDQMKAILAILEEKLSSPVDVEFAHDGRNLYLLQCRPQSYSDDSSPAPIPKDLPSDRILFSANRFVSNGQVPDITHVVYVDPDQYSQLATREEMVEVGRTVNELNKLLPKRQFILMGPGRWGSRGDMKLGVSVTYSDINNTAMLIEIARKKDNYLPDLSFGTHFFQDLVEAQIRYLPLYPDDEGVIFNEHFLTGAMNILGELLPHRRHLEKTIHVIDISKTLDGLILQVLMNADLDEAIGLLTRPSDSIPIKRERRQKRTARATDHWRWRMLIVEQIAADLDAGAFGVKRLFVFGSTKNSTAGPGSDIDLLLHIDGNEEKRRRLALWLEGWSRAVDHMNYLRTGYRSGGLLDIHYVTDEDIVNKTSYAVKIGAITDAAREIPLGGKAQLAASE